MRRVAPTLHGHMVEVKMAADRACEYCPEWAEYRALLAAVSVLRRAVKEARSGKASDHIKTLHAAERALARLDKVSGGRGTK